MNQNELYKNLAVETPRPEIVETPKPEVAVVKPQKSITDEEAGFELDNLATSLYEQYEKLSPAQRFVAEVAPGTGEAISAYETPKYARETKEAFREGNYGETAIKGLLTGMSAIGAVPILGAAVRAPKAIVKTGAKKIAEKIQDTIPIFPKPQRMFKEKNPPAGGEYLNPITKEKLTDKNFQSASIGITPEGKPSFTAKNIEVEKVGSPDIKGATQIKTNLFKKSAGWKWLNAPENYKNAPTLVSIQNKGKHYYTLQADFPQGINLSRYAKSKTEPRLRPTIKGFVNLGKPIGTISVRGKEHPVYDKIINRKAGGAI
tara:strand:+ start:536 stop:1486 length:951 start_codon:yes stop_codon:yes gene_type:complete